MISWNSGLTKETDIRVAETSKKLKDLWGTPEFRKYMIDAHKGKVWNKGLTKKIDIRVAELSKRLTGIKHKYEDREYPTMSRAYLFKDKKYLKEHTQRMKDWNRNNPVESHERAVKAGRRSLESRKEKLPFKLLGIPFLSKGELAVAKWLLQVGIVPEKYENCHVRIGVNEYDFLLFNTFVVEYHPKNNFRKRQESLREYFERRKTSLVKNGRNDLILIPIRNVQEFVYFTKILGHYKMEALI
jgi:hypothetical protein